MSVELRAAALRELFQAGVDAVGGYQATRRTLADFPFSTPVHMIAVGKAADAMASGAIEALKDRLESGLVITKYDHLSVHLQTDPRLQCLESAHPVPDQNSLQAGARLVEFISSIPANHLLIFLVSGGTSALVEHLSEGLSLQALIEKTQDLLASGADIGEMNRLRRTLSQIKGGKLARYLSCPVLQLLISDVPGDIPGDIGSGLLVPDASQGMPASMSVWQRIDTRIIASNSLAQAAVATEARARGLTVQQSAGSLDGPVQVVEQRLSAVVAAPSTRPGVYIWGGEPTVVLPRNPGRGGRNQHLALSLCRHLHPQQARSVLVCGTDGTDGPTPDAGGLVSEQTLKRVQELGLDIDLFLTSADAGRALEALGALVTTGPTGTNVMDLAIAIVE